MATKPPPAADLESSKSPPHKSSHAGIVRSAGIVSAAVLLSRVTGLLREILLARFFGASMVYDAFLAAFRIPNLLRDLLAEGALSSAFVTTFSQELSVRGDESAFRLSNLVASVLVPLLALLSLLGIIFAPQLVDLMFPGFEQVPGKKELTVSLARIMMPFLLFIALAAKAMGVLNAKGQFGLPALASAFFNIVSLATGLGIGFLVGPRLGFEPIVGMAFGTLLGGVAQYVCQVPSMRRVGLHFQPILNLSDPGLRQVMRLMGPAILGAAALQINIVVNSIFASQITNAAGDVIDGPVSWLGYAFRFMQLPLGLFGVAVASATLPAISRSAGAGRIAEFRDTLARSLALVFLLTIPSAVGLFIMSRPIIGLLFQRGRFTASDTEQTAVALSYYCVGLAGYAAIKVLTPAYYALNDVRIPMLTSLASIVLNYAMNWTFIRVLGLGHGGLAFSTSVVATVNFMVLFWLMRYKAGGIEGRRLAWSVTKISLASTLMGAVCWLSSLVIQQHLGESNLARLINVSVSLPLGVLVLYQMCLWLKVQEVNDARAAIAGRLRFPVRRGRAAEPYDRIDRNGN